MASSGSGTHAFARHRLIYEWNIAFQSIPSNNSTVTCKVFLQSVDQYGAMYAPAVNQGYVTLNGEREKISQQHLICLLIKRNFSLPLTGS